MSYFLSHRDETFVSIQETSLIDSITFYKITVKVGTVQWIVSHRFSDFAELHDKLVADHGVVKDLLPPKKIIGNKTAKFVEQRREALQEYIITIFNYLKLSLPTVLAHFLDFHLYDMFYLLQSLAKKLFSEGDELLNDLHTYTLTPLELHAVSQRLKMACPPTEKQDQMYDFSHVLDFFSKLKALKIVGSSNSTGSSNIVPNNLKFDLISFKSLETLSIHNVPMDCIQSVGILRDTLKNLTVTEAQVRSLNEFLLVDIVHKEPESIGETVKWKQLQSIDFSTNAIPQIDWAIKLVPKLQKLNLPANKLNELIDISCLHELTHLNLSLNNFTACENWHSKIGNIVEINLAQNIVVSLHGFSRLYSLMSLNLSCNLIEDVEEVQHICNLPCLEHLWLTANPVASIIDYRVKVIEQFHTRMSELCLDNEKASENELDTARVLHALRLVRQKKLPDFILNNNSSRSFNERR